MKPNQSQDRYEWASSIINKSEEVKPTIFDVGTGDGRMKSLITKNSQYVAFDLAPQDASIQEWDLNQNAPMNSGEADYILLLEVVEHLNNPWIAIKNVSDKLKPGGKLLLTTPNPFWSEVRFTFFFSGWFPCFSISDLERNHHVFTPWPHIIEKLLFDNNLIIQNKISLDGKTELYDKNLLKNPTRIIKRLVKKWIEFRNPSSIGMSYGLIALKIEDNA